MITLTNPVLPRGADPWLTVDGGNWYFICTRGDRLEILCADSPANLSSGQSRIVWTPPAEGPGSKQLWAPELHKIDGRWLIYYAASDGTGDAGRRMHAVVCDGDPMTAEWSYLGMLNTARAGLDGTVMEHRGQRYFLYAGYGDFPEHGSALYIARMRDEVTLEGEEACLTIPEFDWERQGGMPINEGPAILKRNGRIFVIYSASTTWSEDYCLGMLTADENADPMCSESWIKSPEPVFRKCVERRVLAPGHNSFCRYGDADLIVYHAIDGPGGRGDLDASKRSPRIQKVEWADDAPDFGVPVACGVEVGI